MRRLYFLLVLTVAAAVSLATLAVAQQGSARPSNSSQTGPKGSSSSSQREQQQGASASAPNDIPTPDDEPGATGASAQAQPNASKADEKSTKNTNAQKDDRNKAQNQRAPRSDDPQPRGDDENGVATPPATPGESSSKDTKVDLSPPPGDANEHPDSSVDDESSGTSEFRAWDPHRAMKNVEVGDYYYKQQNYRAAASRYQEALQWKPRDAEATFKLADAYEKLGDTIDARDKYETYLKILPKGPRAEDAHKALARLK